MFEEYYEPLPDVDRYLKRIGMIRPTKLTKEYLDELTYAHQKSVPFENLTPFYYKEPVRLETAALYDKVVVKQRGGYCFELNGLYAQLLKDLGYDAYSCPCRIVNNGEYMRTIAHRGTIINIDGKKHFVDVGFGGPSPCGAVELTDKRQTLQNEVYWFEKFKPYWWFLKKETEVPEDPETKTPAGIIEQSVLLISEALWEPIDYISVNEAFSSGPNSRFTQRLTVNVKKPDGHASMNLETLTVMKNGVKTVTEYDFNDKEQFQSLLYDNFGIKL